MYKTKTNQLNRLFMNKTDFIKMREKDESGIYADAETAERIAREEGFYVNKDISGIDLIPQDKIKRCIEEKIFKHSTGKVIGKRLNEEGLREVQNQKEKRAETGKLEFKLT